MGDRRKKTNLGKGEPIEIKNERLDRTFDVESLDDIPLEDRRKEANKPLFLIRYE